MNKLKIFLAASLFMFAGNLIAQSLFEKPTGTQTRWASAENWKGEKGKGGMANGGRKGSASFKLPAGQSKVLAETSGTSGMIRRIWLTIDERTPEFLRGLKIEMFWDDAVTPAVSAPLGDFFNQGLGKMKTFENALFASPEGRSFNCYIPMPFRKSMKITVTNTTEKDVAMFFYDVNYTIGDKVDDDVLYFHAIFNQQQATILKEDYQILPKVNGTGRYLGVNLSVAVNDVEYHRAWWGEGEVKIYLDGDSEFPTLCGTGTEDYIGTGWGQGEYANQYQGCTIADEPNFEYAFYRFHIPDPVYFYEDIKVTIQQIGFAKGEEIEKLSNMKGPIYKAGKEMVEVDFSKEMNYLFFERSDNVTSCAYFYLDSPESPLNAQ
ncbi:glycoside hydrolase family 172 protein [Sunxiuqinia indica]|uniref:glycoside hydrolase family 172 protein n=1 Tax=Sunxiuqinia indica TaxID=2692584 RepID=UPI001357B568|nr:glycoside hydrolase family 172 protein [Sunxiuqinia indica]